MYRLIVAPQGQRELKKIKRYAKEAISLALDEIKEDPLLGKPLTRDLTGKFAYKVGVYRIIYKVNKTDKVVYIISAGHRSIAYQ